MRHVTERWAPARGGGAYSAGVLGLDLPEQCTNEWDEDGSSNQSYVRLDRGAVAEAGAQIDRLICQPTRPEAAAAHLRNADGVVIEVEWDDENYRLWRPSPEAQPWLWRPDTSFELRISDKPADFNDAEVRGGTPASLP